MTDTNSHLYVGICFSLIHLHKVETRFKPVWHDANFYSSVNKGLRVFSSQLQQVTATERDFSVNAANELKFDNWLYTKNTCVQELVKGPNCHIFKIEHPTAWFIFRVPDSEMAANEEQDPYSMYILIVYENRSKSRKTKWLLLHYKYTLVLMKCLPK